MNIEYKCIGCGVALMSDEKYIGRKVQCPRCKIIMEIPSGMPVANPSIPTSFGSQTAYPPYGQVNTSPELQTQAKIEDRIGFGKRSIAVIIDGVLSMIGGIVVGVIFGGMLGGLVGGASGGAAAGGKGAAVGAGLGGFLGGFLGAIIGIAFFGFLYGLIEAFTGASPGKMLLGIKIGTVNGNLAGIKTLFSRYAIKNIAYLCSVLAAITKVKVFSTIGGLLGLIVLIGCFFALGSARQALHDKIAKTAVYPKQSLR